MTIDDGDGTGHRHHEWSRGIRAGTAKTLWQMLGWLFAIAAGILIGISSIRTRYVAFRFAKDRTIAEQEATYQAVADWSGVAHDKRHG